MMALLIQYGADVNTRGNVHRSVLSYALSNKHEEVAELLLAHGADINGDVPDTRTMKEIAKRSMPDRGSSPLVTAANLEMVEYLVAHGADIRREPGIMVAQAALGHSDIVSFLLDRGIDPNERSPGGSTPLHGVKNAETAEVLIAHGAEVNARDGYGLTPLARAVQSRKADVVMSLVSHGATR